MTIKKMTLAAAMTVGLIAGGMNFAMAECGCEFPATGAACPCPQVAAPCAVCPTCKQTPCTCAVPCNPCATPCNKCDCKDDCCNDCCPTTSCAPPAVPACGVGPNMKDAKKSKHQIYAYPEAIYGKDNVFVGECKNGINLTDTPMAVAGNSCGCNTGAAAPINIECGCGGCTTGGACTVPVAAGCGCTAGCVSGVEVARPCDCNTGCALPIIENCGCNTGFAAPYGNNCEDACPINIETETSTQAILRTMSPCAAPCTGAALPAVSSCCESGCHTGAAVPVVSSFCDVPEGFWASCDINKLTENNIIAGYPDRTFKPNVPVSRAEFASMAVKGFNMNENMNCPQMCFKDVPKNHWANKVINTSVAQGLMAGYPNNTFRPNYPVSRAEALTILANGVKCPIDQCKAEEILSKYCDGNNVPAWAVMSIAKAINAGALCELPTGNQILPNKDASRAELASMLEQVRIAGGFSTKDVAVSVPCDCAPVVTPAAGCASGAAMCPEEIVQIPTLKICFADELSSRTVHVGDSFAAKTIDTVTINGKCFPSGSMVRGKVLEVARPSGCDDGGLKLSFNTIDNDGCKVDLPAQVLKAQVNKTNTPNFFSRLIAWPFTTVGQIIGTAGRTVGGAVISLSNAAEEVTNGIGVGTGELFMTGGKCACECESTNRFTAAGRSYKDSVVALVKAPVDLVRTALSGTMGVLQVTGNEVAYLVDPNGKCISAINPREKVTIAFGTSCTTGCAAPCPAPCATPCPAPCAAPCPTPCADPCPAAPCSSPCCD